MNKGEARVAVFAALIESQLDGERLAHLNLDQQLNAIAQMSVLAVERLFGATERFEKGEGNLCDAVGYAWRLDQ